MEGKEGGAELLRSCLCVYACGELFFAFCGSCVVKGAESDWAFIGKMTEEMRIRGKKAREKERERERRERGERREIVCGRMRDIPPSRWCNTL